WLDGVLAGRWGWFVGLFAGGWLGWLVGLLVATVVAFGLWILGKAVGKVRLWKRWSRLEPIDRLYQQMTYQLSKQGFVPLRSQTPLEYAQQVSGGVSAELSGIVSAIARSYVAWRYGGEQADVGPLQARWRSARPQPIRRYRRRIK
ncbi:MAG: DUF4129 domain-containing protein, partial [Alkalinema sp. RU_4_3]|nr:DUF4129 domain-containing protein [Alkalinema sp. RU_4_3]